MDSSDLLVKYKRLVQTKKDELEYKYNPVCMEYLFINISLINCFNPTKRKLIKTRKKTWFPSGRLLRKQWMVEYLN